MAAIRFLGVLGSKGYSLWEMPQLSARAYRPSVKTTSMVVTTSTGSPFNMNGE